LNEPNVGIISQEIKNMLAVDKSDKNKCFKSSSHGNSKNAKNSKATTKL